MIRTLLFRVAIDLFTLIQTDHGPIQKWVCLIYFEKKSNILNVDFKEVLAPQRPPAPPTEYYQMNLGGFDTLNLLKMTPNSMPGFVGCIRGLQLGDYLVDLETQLASSDIGNFYDYCKF